MKPDADKGTYTKMVVHLLTEALRTANIYGIEQLGDVQNFKPFRTADDREGAFLHIGMFVSKSAGQGETAPFVGQLNAIIMETYYQPVKCCACKSDMQVNAHHWNHCPLERMRAVIQPVFFEVWKANHTCHVSWLNNRQKKEYPTRS